MWAFLIPAMKWWVFFLFSSDPKDSNSPAENESPADFTIRNRKRKADVATVSANLGKE